MAIRDLVPWKNDKEVQVRRMEDALPAFHRAIDSLFNEFFRGFDLAPFSRFFDESFTAGMPAARVEETDTEYKVSVDVPGWDEKDIDVTLSGDVLTIKGEKKDESEEGKKGDEGYRSRTSYGSFSQSVRLPLEVDPEKVTATCSRGVITVTLPKTEEAQNKVHKIEVKAS